MKLECKSERVCDKDVGIQNRGSVWFKHLHCAALPLTMCWNDLHSKYLDKIQLERPP